MFNSELEFEKAVIEHLIEHGWEKNVLKNKTPEQLLDNWADILYNNNKGIDRLNGHPLTSGEKAQLIEQIKILKSPLNLNKFINGKTISIKRDNPNDTLHYGKEVSLEIYDRDQIAGGKSIYQIVEQPIFPTKHALASDRRGDLMLLINGMPVIHIELKKSGIPVSQATEQIKKYSEEGVFTGIYALIQVFVAMTPEHTLYFANPGDGKFNPAFYFKWADKNNEEYKTWNKVVEHLLSIPMAHKLIGFYTVPDDGDGILKVMRSYQYYAVESINSRVDKAQWTSNDKLGGYICHTTGSGKTMTSFKAAQLLANSKKVDKVVFLMDRIELGTQSALSYRNFADDRDEIQETEDTFALIEKLKSSYSKDTLIVTSIQKMSNIEEDAGVNKRDIDIISLKKIVFIIDECHRSTFGDMLSTIKKTFPNALYFGFTGTPIYEENQKKLNTTTTVFGNELHRYSIADGIRDKNVLGFDPYKVLTFKDRDLRIAVGLNQAKATDYNSAMSNPKQAEIIRKFQYDIPMAGYYTDTGTYVKGIEDYIDEEQYERNDAKAIEEQHQYHVVKNILENWNITSVNSKFHAIFATSSIKEAIEYYRLFKDMMGKNKLPELKIACLFDESIDNNGGSYEKEKAIIEMLEDYYKMFNVKFTIPRYQAYKKDLSWRLAHKEKYNRIHSTNPNEQVNILIVVDQMLTGFDSKWINTLYLDKYMKYEGIVQAFSRTNRIFGKDKPHGVIKYYRRPHSMERNVEAAFKLYSGEKPFGIFVEKLEKNLNTINSLFKDISDLFKSDGIENFEKLPSAKEDKAKFAQLFSFMTKIIEAAKIQGFVWDKLEYHFDHNDNISSVIVNLDEATYLILALRYKELFINSPVGPKVGTPFDIDSTAIEIDTGKIDSDYLNKKFKKYIEAIQEYGKDAELVKNILKEVHKAFASLSQTEQKFAEIILFDIQNGSLVIEDGKTFRDYINQYQINQKNNQIHLFASRLGINEIKLINLMNLKPTEANINEYGRFDDVKNSVNLDVASEYFIAKDGKKYPRPRLIMKVESLLRDFIIQGGFDI